MSTRERGRHSAASSTLGYFYQCRYALLAALCRLPEGDRISVSLETLDDVVFDTDGSAVDVLQTKHHTNARANLADASPDLWKTLRIWIEGQADGTIPRDAQFFLITTAVCKDGTAAAYLRPGVRNNVKALERLRATASTSISQANLPAYQAFNSMKRVSLEFLVQSITILDGSPSVGQLDDRLKKAVFYAAERQFLDSYIQRLEGWWFRRVVAHLRNDNSRPILGEEIEAESNHIREQFKQDNLPVDDDIMRATVDASGYLGKTFVEQLNLIDINHSRVLHAIRNYYRAFEQRSRWMREDLLYVGELGRYEDRLIEEWDVMFQQMSDELGEDAADEAKVRAARNLYKWVETGSHHVIRSSVMEPAIARGTYQMLADDLRVGWHLEFRKRVQALLARTETGR